jgi:hypothetical protein
MRMRPDDDLYLLDGPHPTYKITGTILVRRLIFYSP